MQGLGLFTMEELVWGDEKHGWWRPGQLFSAGPGTYKIPAFGDVPQEFKVRLLNESPNARTIHSSKAVGEPPFFLAAAAFFAVRRAVAAARLESPSQLSATNGASHTEQVPAWFALDSPASSERIRMACRDEVTEGLRVPADYKAPGSV